MEKNIALQLLAVDFKNTDFVFFGKCAIEKAIFRQLGIDRTYEGVRYVSIEGTMYKHIEYNNSDFSADQREASGKRDDSLIRTIILTRA